MKFTCLSRSKYTKLDSYKELKLKKELTLIDVFCIATGAMISSGLFILPGLAYAKAGPAVVLSYFLAGLVSMAGTLSITELSTAMPKAGGDYFFITRSLGPAAGTVAGIFSWLSLSLKSAFALVGMAVFTRLIIDLDILVIAILLCLIFVLINFLGIKIASKIQVILVFGLLGILFVYVARSLSYINVQQLIPFTPNGVLSVFSTTGFVFISYGGILKITSIAEEVKDPHRTIPRGLILSLVVTTLLYGIVIFATIGLLKPEDLKHSITPISDGAYISMGMPGKLLLSVAAILAFVTTANAGVMAASRYPFALSRDRLYPDFFKKVYEKFGTPYISIFFTGLFIIIFLFLELELLVKVASTVFILTHIMSILSVIVFRASCIKNYQPSFRAPLFPWIQIIGILGFIFMIIEMRIGVILISVALIIIGISIYLFYGKRRTKIKEYALLYVMDRITQKKLARGQLESELLKLIQERDGNIKDGCSKKF